MHYYSSLRIKTYNHPNKPLASLWPCVSQLNTIKCRYTCIMHICAVCTHNAMPTHIISFLHTYIYYTHTNYQSSPNAHAYHNVLYRYHCLCISALACMHCVCVCAERAVLSQTFGCCLCVDSVCATRSNRSAAQQQPKKKNQRRDKILKKN